MEREDEKNEADKINSDISRQISSDMPGGRQRSYSQENLAPQYSSAHDNEQSEAGCGMIDMSQDIQKQHALSQFHCNQSNFGDDEDMTQHLNNDDGGNAVETESDNSEKDNNKKIAEVIENQTFNFSLFKAFMDWQCKNQLS